MVEVKAEAEVEAEREVVVEVDKNQNHDQKLQVVIVKKCFSPRQAFKSFTNSIITEYRVRDNKRRHSPSVSPPARSYCKKKIKTFDRNKMIFLQF